MRIHRQWAVAALALLVACDSFIDPDPRDVLTPENFYQTSSDAVAAVNAIYGQVKWAYWLGFWYLSDIATDDIAASANFGSDGHRMSEYNFNSSEWPMGDVWGNAYNIINRSNAVLERVPPIAMDEQLKERLLAEAHFMRALAYFNIVRFFGDVPLITAEVNSLENLEVARSPADEVYTLIISDLEAAAPALPASYSSGDLGRVTNGAARSLLAKVHLTRENWAEAAEVAGGVITSGRYQLLPNWKDNFSVASELANPESILEINYDGIRDPGAGSVHTLFSLPFNYPGGDAYGLMYIPPSLASLFAANDERGNNGTFMRSGKVDALDRTVTWAVPPGPAFNKYLDEDNNQNMMQRAWASQNNNWIVLRYADVLLMYAEAVNEGGGATAGTKEAALNLVRQRAGLAPISGLALTAFRDSVRLERRRELVFEGHRWFDLSRWGTLADVMAAKFAELDLSGSVPPNNLLPLPQGELDRNPSLTQNPGW
jgi:hypothetical protein